MTFLLPADDWMAGARIGTTDMLDRIARLPGLLKKYSLFFSDPNRCTPSSQACLYPCELRLMGSSWRSISGSTRCWRSRTAKSRLRVDREFHEMSHSRRSAGNHSQGIEEECRGREVEESRPGNASRGTVHLVELHQQLKRASFGEQALPLRQASLAWAKGARLRQAAVNGGDNRCFTTTTDVYWYTNHVSSSGSIH